MGAQYYKDHEDDIALIARARAFLFRLELDAVEEQARAAQQTRARRRTVEAARARKSLEADRQKVLAALQAGETAPAPRSGAYWNVSTDPLRRPPDEETRDYIKVLRNDPCAYCGGRTRHIDHVEPVSRGGGSEWENLAPACGKCNSSKCDQSLLEFLLKKRDVRRREPRLAEG